MPSAAATCKVRLNRGLKAVCYPHRRRCAGDAEVINVTMSDVKPGTLDLMQQTMNQGVWQGKIACPGAVRYPYFKVVENKFIAVVLAFLYHILFGATIDTALVLLGRKPE